MHSQHPCKDVGIRGIRRISKFRAEDSLPINKGCFLKRDVREIMHQKKKEKRKKFAFVTKFCYFAANLPMGCWCK